MTAVVLTRFPTANDVFTVSWDIPANVYADDNSDASGSLSWGANGSSNVANLYKSFNFDDIPDGSTIVSVKVILESEGLFIGGSTEVDLQINARVNGLGLGYHFVWVVNGNSTTHVRDTLTIDITADRAWTRNDLLNASFQVELNATGFDDGGLGGGSGTAAVDYLKVEVTYNTPPTPYERGRF